MKPTSIYVSVCQSDSKLIPKKEFGKKKEDEEEEKVN